MHRLTYLLITVLSSLDSNNLSDGLNVVLGRVINELNLHRGVVLKMLWLVHTLVEGLSTGSKTGLSVGGTIHILGLDTWEVSTVTYLNRKENK